jgi:hypothetical protein
MTAVDIRQNFYMSEGREVKNTKRKLKDKRKKNTRTKEIKNEGQM